MSKTIEYIVECPIDIDREDFNPPDQWVIDRIKLFHDFTLRSLLNQTDGDFKIHALCGDRHRHVTENYKWHERVTPVYNRGLNIIKSLEADYLVVSRLDSDDLWHKDNSEIIKKNLILTNEVECLIFRKSRLWDRINQYIGSHYNVATPFFTHIFPKSIYKTPAFEQVHFCTHGSAGGRWKKTKELPINHICVVKHAQNTGRAGKGNRRGKLTPAQMERFGVEYYIDNDYEEMKTILADFGVTPKEIQEQVEV